MTVAQEAYRCAICGQGEGSCKCFDQDRMDLWTGDAARDEGLQSASRIQQRMEKPR